MEAQGILRMTKARTKSQRRKHSRAGRPRKQGVERYPSGDIKRSETEKEVKRVAIEAARRVHGIDTDGKDGLHAYTLGRMFLDKKINKPELEAGNWYAEQIERYYRATGRQSPNPRAQDFLAVRGHDGEVTMTAQERAQRASSQFTTLETVLGCVGNGVRSTVWNVCIMDMEALRLMSDSQLAMLRAGLRALAKTAGIPTVEAA